MLDNLGELVKVDAAEALIKAEQLFEDGFGVADAAHVAFAEAAGADLRMSLRIMYNQDRR